MGDKRKLVYLFLSLSFTYFTMINKKHTSLLSDKIGTDGSNYGKTDTFESIHRLLYLLLLCSIEHYHSPWSCAFICDNNENGDQPVFSPFFKRTQRNTEPWTIGMPLNMSALYKKVRNIPSSCWLLYFLNDVFLIPFVAKNVVHVTIPIFFHFLQFYHPFL
jgi:hypothetical protein